MLSETIYGTTGLRLKHLDAEKKVKELVEPDFHVMLDRKGRVVAVVVFCKRNHPFEGVQQSYYIRYFSVDKKYQQLGLGKVLVANAASFYKEILSVPTLVYAYIEGKNIRSISVSKHFEPKVVSSFKTLFFSRFNPRVNLACRNAGAEELDKVKALVSASNFDLVSFQTNRIGYQDNCFVFEENGVVVAGAQAILTNWEVVNNPGFSGFIMQKILPKLPFIKRLAQGDKMKFVSLEGLFYKDIKQMEILIEHILAKLSCNIAFIYFDMKDKRLPEFEQSVSLGLVSKVQKAPLVNVLHFGWRLSEDVEEKLIQSPNYISAYDIT